MNRVKLWRYLTLEQQMNVDCDQLAKAAVSRSMEGPALPDRGRQLLPLERAAIFIDGCKCTTDVADNVQFCLGDEDARAFYTAPKKKKGGGLGWSKHRFNQVSWASMDSALASKPDRYSLWLSKQASGWCATRQQMGRMQDLLDDKCPTCQRVVETSQHLNISPDEGRTQLFRESVELSEKWLHQGNRTDPELAYWIPKYLLFRGQKKISDMGVMSPALQRAASSIDKIRWVEMLHGKVSVEIAAIQEHHCVGTPCHMNGADWMKHYVSHLICISHSQWVYRNFVLHERVRGYLRLKERKEVLVEIDKLLDMDPDKLPEDSRFLLELDFDTLYNSTFERQSYWVQATKAARHADRRAARLRSCSCATGRQRKPRRKPRPMIRTDTLEAQICKEVTPQPSSVRRRLHPSSLDTNNPCNMRLRSPD